MKVRQDAWSEEDDLLLAETVLRHVREGSTQLRAFDEVGDALNRTSAACGFRWNAVVRDKYDDAIKLAKKHRKERQRMLAQESKPRTYGAPLIEQTPYQIAPSPVQQNHFSAYSGFTEMKEREKEMSLQDVIQFLKKLNSQGYQETIAVHENETLKLQNNELSTKVASLEKELATIKEEYQVVEEDYQSIIQIMNRARRMALLEEEDEERNAPTFRMDKNGNLEKIAK